MSFESKSWVFTSAAKLSHTSDPPPQNFLRDSQPDTLYLVGKSSTTKTHSYHYHSHHYRDNSSQSVLTGHYTPTISSLDTPLAHHLQLWSAPRYHCYSLVIYGQRRWCWSGWARRHLRKCSRRRKCQCRVVRIRGHCSRGRGSIGMMRLAGYRQRRKRRRRTRRRRLKQRVWRLNWGGRSWLSVEW